MNWGWPRPDNVWFFTVFCCCRRASLMTNLRQNDLRELSKDKEDEDGEEKPRGSVGHLWSIIQTTKVKKVSVNGHLWSVLPHPNPYCLSPRLVAIFMIWSENGAHLVHCFDQADGEDGEEQTGDELQGDAVNWEKFFLVFFPVFELSTCTARGWARSGGEGPTHGCWSPGCRVENCFQRKLNPQDCFSANFCCWYFQL